MPDIIIASNTDLAPLNTLALSARAAHLASITSAGQLPVLAADPCWSGMPRFVLGGGSNLVLTGHFDGLMLRMAITGRQLASEDADAWYVRAGAGENWHDFVGWTLAQGWPGLENLSLIPGTVGAAPIQNIGAYGLEVAERFHSLSACDMLSGQTVRFDRDACRFGYRDSVFKQEGWHLDGRLVITDVTFRLSKNWQPLTRYADVAAEINKLDANNIKQANARQIADAIIAIRQRKLPDPALIPNAGSFFHNPVVDASTADQLLVVHPGLPRYPQLDGRCKLAAGWLIEQAGWKGKNLGPVGMFEKQALVLVNHGGATGTDVLGLMQAIQRDVKEKFGIELTPEPIFL
ncbi:UDP-N-acetylmuramate dehydrogenase [Propionivibrio sp.]|uniref:UDP-N-acetylmuramate dehydrogenase n=1 Tax=Propionivibrio sp. TaxID=2212460 RepID=UPI003BF17A7B